MKRTLLLMIITLMAIGFISSSIAEADPRANPVFSEASIYLYDDFKAHFTASTMIICPQISVSSCFLHVYRNGTWKNHSSLTVPTDSGATNTAMFDALEDYYNSVPQGGKYRIKATFSGAGQSVTRYSNARTK